jgi:hypothetical protein
MTGRVQEMWLKSGSESEKITINVGYVDLGHVDFRDGFYANRTDFIRIAIRNQLERHADATRLRLALQSRPRPSARATAYLKNRRNAGEGPD